MNARRPEHQAPADIYYNEREAAKYTNNTRIIQVQTQCTERALELLALPDEPSLILDIGCGSGLSGEVVTEHGHTWVGFDISPSMLDVATSREVEGDLLLSDIGDGLPLRPASFDGAISISTLQWLCNADYKHHVPVKRLANFFRSLYACLVRGSRAVLQFYPDGEAQMELLVSQAMRAGFQGGVIVDFPNSTKAKKFFLVLMTGGGGPLPEGLTDSASVEERRVAHFERRERIRAMRPKNFLREKIKKQKERRMRQGKEVRPFTKYTGRKRSGRF